MALRISSLVQNQNHGINFNGASIGGNIDPPKVQKKGGGLGGRKPLNDLSNAQKPSLDQTLKKGGAKSLADDVNRKSSTTKASERVHRSTTRKALTDISNSDRPRGSEKVKKNSKIKVLAEEPYHITPIAEERFLHNHQECIKLQAGHKDIDYFMETLGLHKDLLKKLASPWASPPSSRLKMEDLLRSVQHEGMTELLAAVGSPQKHEHFKELDSPYPRSPRSPYDSMLWKEYDDINFTLAENPKIPRF